MPGDILTTFASPAGRGLKLVPRQYSAALLLLHGHRMPLELLGHPAGAARLGSALYVPDGGMPGPSWWVVDDEKRARQRLEGPLDLAHEQPHGLDAAAQRVAAIALWIGSRHPDVPLVLAGFSQGASLAAHVVLTNRVRPSGLALLSGSPVAMDQTLAGRGRLDGMPVLIAHGLHDAMFTFSGSEILADAFLERGCEVSKFQFDGGHEVTIGGWRRLRSFIVGISNPRNARAPT